MKINVATEAVADPDTMARFVAAQAEIATYIPGDFAATPEGWESPNLTNYGEVSYVMIVLNRQGIAFTTGVDDLHPLF